MRRTLTINQQDANHNDTKVTVGYVNTTATDAKIYEFATKINALTEDTFINAMLTEERELSGD